MNETDEERDERLSWASTEELWEELAGRFQSCLLLYDCPGRKKGEANYGVMEKPEGSPIGTLGLVHFSAMLAPIVSQRVVGGLGQSPIEGFPDSED